MVGRDDDDRGVGHGSSMTHARERGRPRLGSRACALRIDLSYDGTDFRGWATQPGLRTVQGTLEAALATVLRVPDGHRGLRRSYGHRRPRPRPGGPPRPPTTSTTGCCGGSTASCRRTYGCAWSRRPTRGSTPGSRRSGGATPTGSRTAPRLLDPLRRAARALVAAAARRRRDGGGCAGAARPAGLRRVLQAPRGGDHDPYAAGARLGPRRRRAGGGDRAGRRVLPPHGPLARRLPAGGRRGAASRRLARRGPGRRAARPGRGGGAGPRADPGGGRLPGPGRAGRAGGRGRGRGGRRT